MTSFALIYSFIVGGLLSIFAYSSFRNQYSSRRGFDSQDTWSLLIAIGIAAVPISTAIAFFFG